MTDFDPLRCPPQFAKWRETATQEDREKHAAIFLKRQMSAATILDGLGHLRLAASEMDQDCGLTDRLKEAIEEAFAVAEELHDYDPTSD